MLTKRGDTSPVLALAPVNGSGLIAELSGASTARVIVRGVPDGTLTEAEIDDDFIGYLRVKGIMVPSPKVAADADLDPATGTVTYQLLAADVDTEGDWLLEVEYDIAGDGLKLETTPTDGYVAWRIIEDEDA